MASGHLMPYVASANEEVAFSFYFISTNLHSKSSRIIRSINKCWVEEKVEKKEKRDEKKRKKTMRMKKMHPEQERRGGGKEERRDGGREEKMLITSPIRQYQGKLQVSG